MTVERTNEEGQFSCAVDGPKRRMDDPFATRLSGVQSVSQDEPLLVVNQFTSRIEVAGVDGGFDQHVQNYLPETVHPELAEEVRPPRGGGI